MQSPDGCVAGMGTGTGAWTGSAKKVVRCGGSAGAGAGAWVSNNGKGC